jgi:hypothetical protein
MGQCKNCIHFGVGSEAPPYGSCARWNTGYSYNTSTMPLNEVCVESDEGWCMVVGPEFGCVLFEEKS